MKDPRVKAFMRELTRHLPGTTLITGPMPDEPDSGEILIKVLNAPMEPPRYVSSIAFPLMWKIWGDEPRPVLVAAVGPEDSIKYYAKHLAKARKSRVLRRRARATPRKRTAAR